jgi:hypothetical protein
MITWLRDLIERNEREADEIDNAATRDYYWCTCERPVPLVFDDTAPGWVCDCGGIIWERGCAEDAK